MDVTGQETIVNTDQTASFKVETDEATATWTINDLAGKYAFLPGMTTTRTGKTAMIVCNDGPLPHSATVSITAGGDTATFTVKCNS